MNEEQGGIKRGKNWKQKGKCIKICVVVSFCFGNKKLLTQREKANLEVIKQKLVCGIDETRSIFKGWTQKRPLEGHDTHKDG